MPTRKFTLEDQSLFAELSGDHNPMHVDPVEARRYIFGKPVVHGMHSALWGLDRWLERSVSRARLRLLNARFLSPVALEEPVECFAVCADGQTVQIEIMQGDSLVTELTAAFDAADENPDKGFEQCFPDRTPPVVLSLEQIRGRSGHLDLYFEEKAASTLFPNLVRFVPAVQISVLLSTTRLVGMQCPGYHSIYSQLEISASETSNSGLCYEVANVDERFKRLSMRVSAPGLSGLIKAFIRPAPQEQLAYLGLAKQVEPGEFADQAALIIGGSRGLGEVTAKLLAAGGARTRITYHRGKETAERIVHESISNGGDIDCVAFDILDQINIHGLVSGQGLFTHLYYFATPFISGKKGVFSPELFSKFCDYYVTRFARLVDHLAPLGLKKVFYPSSIFVGDVPLGMGEYAAAKAAGEALCEFLQNNNRQMTIYKPRLPKMATDQTASLMPADNQDAASVILQNLRSFGRY